jgi:hypothetical protein
MPLTSVAGRGRCTICLTSLERVHVPVPPAKAARELAVVSQQRGADWLGRRAGHAQLHDDPGRNVERVGQAVDRPEGLASQYPTRFRRADNAVTNVAAVPRPSLTRGSASKSMAER